MEKHKDIFFTKKVKLTDVKTPKQVQNPFGYTHNQRMSIATMDKVLDLLRSSPMTIEQMAKGSNLGMRTVQSYLRIFRFLGVVARSYCPTCGRDNVFFIVKRKFSAEKYFKKNRLMMG